MLFNELIAKKSREELEAFCQFSGLNDLTKLTKEELLTTITNTILSKEGLRELVFLFPKSSFELLEELTKQKVFYNKNNFIAYINAEKLLLMTRNEKGLIIVPDDVMALFREINDKEFKNEYKIKHHMVISIRFADTFYGYYSTKEFENLIKLNSYVANSPAGMAYYKSIVGDDMTSEDVFTNLSETDVQTLKRVQADKPYYLPSLNELEELYTYGYIATPQLNNFLDVVSSKINSIEGRYYIGYQLQNFLNSKNSKPTSFLGGLLPKLGDLKKTDIRYLTLLFVNAVNSMHVVANRGYSPDAIKKFVNK